MKLEANFAVCCLNVGRFQIVEQRRRFLVPFWFHFGSILVQFWSIFSLICDQFLVIYLIHFNGESEAKFLVNFGPISGRFYIDNFGGFWSIPTE